ncbi:MAG: hypothetical protein M0Q38_07270 [Bacteroidales bacterium]|jgi:hypothetical protein|nr:hypothetical protein [Bacteroidales bacterium]
MKGLRFFCIMLLLPALGLSQNYSISRRFWALNSINGAVKLGADYRYQAGYSNEIYNTQESSRFYGGILLNTDSYFIHPDFISLHLGGEFNPVIGKDLFLVIPDQAEVRTMEKLDATLTFFRQKTINFSGFFNYNNVYTSRENLSNIHSNTINFGGNFIWMNKILPIQASYQQGKWYETEILTGRSFITQQQTIQARIDKSFSAYDNSQLIYFHNDYSRNDVNIAESRNISDNLSLNNTISFDKKRNYSFISAISGIDQRGSDVFRRIQVDESINLNLPKRFSLSTSYNFYDYRRDSQEMNQNAIRAMLRHRLYESLNSGLSLEYNQIRHTFYKENNLIAGININYEKKIPLKGRLMLGYTYNWQRQKHTSEPVPQPILHEEHVLTDGQMTLLNQANIDLNSVVVKDVTGTIIYEPNFDYVLIQRNTFLEIQRMPGGQIPNKGSVYVDYVAMLPGSYQYDVNFQCINASVSFFNRLFEIYFKWADQGYSNLTTAEYLTLNYFTQTTYGCRLEYKFASGGVEFENYQSTIVPYRLIRYWAQLQGNLGYKVTISLSGNMRDYNLTAENTRQQFIDVTGNVGYQFAHQSTLSVEFGYRKQIGQQIDLNLLTGRVQFTTLFRQIFFKVGVEVFRRDYLHEQTNYVGGFIQIVRNFNWYRK